MKSKILLAVAGLMLFASTSTAGTVQGTQSTGRVTDMLVDSAGRLRVDVATTGGVTTSMGAGNVDTGTQRVTIATDDANLAAIKVAVEIMDDWDDGSDRAQVDIAAQTLTAVKVSADAAANTISNPMFVQISQDGTNAVDATHPWPVSKDLAANATGNRIWVTSDMDMVAGTATNVNGGAKDAGTQTVILATDDPAVVAVQLIDDTVGTHDSAAVAKAIQQGLEARTSRGTAVANGDTVRGTANEYGEAFVAGYVYATNSIRGTETNPLSEHWSPYSTVLTNITANTTDYIYIPMRGKKHFTSQWELTEASTDLLTVTLECSTEDDCAPASCGYQDVTNMLCGFASALSSNAAGADEFCIADTAVFFSYCRIKYVTANSAGDDADLTVWTTTGY